MKSIHWQPPEGKLKFRPQGVCQNFGSEAVSSSFLRAAPKPRGCSICGSSGCALRDQPGLCPECKPSAKRCLGLQFTYPHATLIKLILTVFYSRVPSGVFHSFISVARRNCSYRVFAKAVFSFWFVVFCSFYCVFCMCVCKCYYLNNCCYLFCY